MDYLSLKIDFIDIVVENGRDEKKDWWWKVERYGFFCKWFFMIRGKVIVNDWNEMLIER